MSALLFKSLDDYWQWAIRMALQCPPGGSRDGNARETLGTAVRFPMNRNWLWNPGRKAKSWYGAAELLWYLSGTRDGTMMEHYAKQYGRFLDENSYAYGAYGHRWAEFDQLNAALCTLREYPNTRQSVICSWHPKDIGKALQGTSKDIPCTLDLQFLLRNSKLNVIVTMRSSDLWLGVPYDMYCFGEIGKMFAAELGVEPGWLQHQAGSLHLYERDVDKVDTVDFPVLGEFNEVPRLGGYSDTAFVDAKQAVAEEKKMREGSWDVNTFNVMKQESAFDEMLACIAYRNGFGRITWLDERL